MALGTDNASLKMRGLSTDGTEVFFDADDGDDGDSCDDLQTEKLPLSPRLSTCTSTSLSSMNSLSVMEGKQLAQLFDKGIDDEGCASILSIDLVHVREARALRRAEAVASDSCPSTPTRVLGQCEQTQLRELFVRQVTPESCAKILHLDVNAVKDFNSEEAVTRAGWLQQRFAVPHSLPTFASNIVDSAKRRAFACVATRPHFIYDKAFRVSAASTAVGTVAGGAVGGGTGTVLGGMIGAVAGMGPALFTFGMSIPVAATIGSGVGLCIGTVSGATVGAVAGGASGYAGFTYRDTLWEKASSTAKMLGMGNRMHKLKLKSLTAVPTDEDVADAPVVAG